MIAASALLPTVVLLPLGVAAALLVLEKVLPRRSIDAVAVVVSCSVVVLCILLVQAASKGPVIHWFGGWTPDMAGKPGVVLGIAFSADPASAAVAGFCGFLFVATFVFAWGYFDEVRAHFHVLMLLFLAAMIGFCLTRDLFDLFVWFELMSVAAYALTAYPLGPSSLEGAFNFIVVNTIGSYLLLVGIGLIYARVGALDYVAIGEAVTHSAHDPVVLGAFSVIALSLLTKGACLPFHFWLTDAHAVAPSPVSVIFSGAMVSLALFGLAKLIAIIFLGDAEIMMLVSQVLPWLGAATALLGALCAWAQRHLKRMLAFSTIAHLGIMLAGLSVSGGAGRAGFLLYMVGHGLVKASLFMMAGMLLALRASVDEIDLYGRGRRLWPIGAAMTLAALLLGGLPFGLLHGGEHMIEAAAGRYRLLPAALMVSAALTGAAVLRATSRIFAGISGTPGPERRGATEREHEKNDRPLWLMMAPCLGLLALTFIPARWGEHWARIGAAALPGPPLISVQPGRLVETVAPVTLTILLLALSLMRRRPTSTTARYAAACEAAPFAALQVLHSGLVGDYVAWLVLGLAAFAVAFMII